MFWSLFDIAIILLVLMEYGEINYSARKVGYLPARDSTFSWKSRLNENPGIMPRL